MTQIVAAGAIQYQYMVVVYDNDNEPCLFVASEVNSMAKAFGGGSHFLGVFPGDGHSNMGDSNDWADQDKFFARASEIVRNHFAKPA